jgi:hypothetical protein
MSVTAADLCIVNGHDRATSAAAIRAFVAAGGGLVIGNHNWGPAWTDNEAATHSNILLQPMGIM